jgi:hypothetical protein
MTGSSAPIAVALMEPVRRSSINQLLLEFIVKKLFTTLIGTFVLTAAASASAGPDWQLIAKARKEKQPAAETTRVSSSGTSAATGDCRVEPLVQQVDHGPRGQTTPYQNEQRRQRHEAQMRACGGTTK